ncbi:TPA: N-glycosylase/DNA lyase [Candidatus Micrarchaeota archaeon]|nr:N-glycosylase/DNA lyase [Candidatus Micrarchaeota archaeon]
MEKLIIEIERLKKTEIGELVRKKMHEFRKKRKNEAAVFSELCFCLLTANSSAEMGIKVQDAIETGFETMEEGELRDRLRGLGYRFYNVRAKYIIGARKHKENVWAMITEAENEFDLREWLVDNIRGLGYKEASHFLRNIGFENLAILDRHILRTLHENGLIEGDVPKSLDRKRYLKYEKEMEKICTLANLPQGELDFYLWYLKTGKVLK